MEKICIYVTLAMQCAQQFLQSKVSVGSVFLHFIDKVKRNMTVSDAPQRPIWEKNANFRALCRLV